MFAVCFVVRQIEVMKFRAILVADEAGALLEIAGLEIDEGGCAEAVCLLASCHE